MRATTVDEPGFDEDFLRPDLELEVSSAIDASMDRDGGAGRRNLLPDRAPEPPQQTPTFQFDLWHDAWDTTRSPWLGVGLGRISRDLEAGLIGWPVEYRNELYDIAWTYFLSCTHESMWSKQSIDPSRAASPLDVAFGWEPEDFVISESLQMRNAWVYLNAAVWARWAEQNPPAGTFVLDPSTAATGDQTLLTRLRQTHSADAWWAGAPAAGHGCYWDRDNQANVVLYNAEVLAVLDRNGGRLTQLFCRVAGRPVSVSGTNKAYQFLDVGAPQIDCDGQRLQNTVYTPNHGYIATDVIQSRPRLGTKLDQRAQHPEPTWLPDNFNAYACTVLPGTATVECRYEVAPGPAGTPFWDDLAAAECVVDGKNLRSGQPGIIWHDESPAFRKTITLSGRTLHIRYVDTQPGHLVANEFSVDLLDLLQGGDPQVRSVGSTTATITGAADLAVTITLGAGCAFSTEAGQVRGPGTRVLTEDVQIVGSGVRLRLFDRAPRLSAGPQEMQNPSILRCSFSLG